MTKEQVEQKLVEISAEYERELRNGSGEHANDHAKTLHGWIRALSWVLENWV